MKSRISRCWAWSGRQPVTGGVVLGCIGCLLVLLTLDPSGSYPWLWAGPGVTVDESFNVQQGLLLVEAFRAYGLFLFDPLNTREVFGGEGVLPYLPDHPPLGRWVLGICHHLSWMLAPPVDPGGPAATVCGRTGSALMYGLTIFLIGATAGVWFGRPAGWVAAASVLLMPRVFGHAHLAALESSVNLTYGLAVLCLADRLRSVPTAWSGEPNQKQEVTSRQRIWHLLALVGFPGLVLGLALLTKIQGFLVVPCVVLWWLFYWRAAAVLPLICWGLIGGLVFFVGWPWLWLDPIGHLQQFLGTATERVSLNNYYGGRVYVDVETPWHYPWVMFLVTVPLGLQVLGGIGLWRTLREWKTAPAPLLVVLCILFPLVLFSTRTAVYDGARLFLMVFPLWGLLIGRGGALLWDSLSQRTSPARAKVVLACLLASQAWGLWQMAPTHLSYYNLLVSGTGGAARWGLEANYWGDSLNRSFLQACVGVIEPGAQVELFPVLHQFQCEEMEKQSPLIRQQGWQIVPAEATAAAPSQGKRYVLMYERLADLPDIWKERPAQVELRRGGRRLGALFVLEPAE